MKLSNSAALAAISLFALSGTPGYAQDTPAPAGKLLFELNNALTVEGGCQLTFKIQNDTGTQIEKSSYNMAIVNSAGQVATLITFEFRPLPVGRKKIQQFGLAGQPCENISAISINEFVECLGPDGAAMPVCEAAIEESSLTTIQFPW